MCFPDRFSHRHVLDETQTGEGFSSQMTGEGAEGRRLALGSTLSPLSALILGTLGSLGMTSTPESFLHPGLRVIWESAVARKVESPASMKTSRGRW